MEANLLMMMIVRLRCDADDVEEGEKGTGRGGRHGWLLYSRAEQYMAVTSMTSPPITFSLSWAVAAWVGCFALDRGFAGRCRQTRGGVKPKTCIRKLHTTHPATGECLRPPPRKERNRHSQLGGAETRRVRLDLRRSRDFDLTEGVTPLAPALSRPDVGDRFGLSVGSCRRSRPEWYH